MRDGVNRRRLLGAISIGATGGIAGCLTVRTTENGDSGRNGSIDLPTPSNAEEGGEKSENDELGLEPAINSFVETDGIDFKVDGETLYVSGVSNCCLVQQYTSQRRIEDFMTGAAALNVGVIRFKAGKTGVASDGCQNPMEGCELTFQPEPGKYDDRALKMLDYVIARAGAEGIRVILPLIDNWEDRETFVDWSSTAKEPDDFYTDEECWDLYADWVDHVLTRENVYTGRTYREDPTIFAWQAMSEPRADPDAATVVDAWIRDAAEYIKKIDGDHLVSTGSEGFTARAHEGTHFVDNHDHDVIDFCGFHLWPDHWGYEDEAGEFGESWIKSRTELAHETLGKPVLLGEYGWILDRGTDDLESEIAVRNKMFATWHEAVLDAGTNGGIVWSLVPPDQRADDLQTDRGSSGVVYEDDDDTIALLRSFFRDIDERSDA